MVDRILHPRTLRPLKNFCYNIYKSNDSIYDFIQGCQMVDGHSHYKDIGSKK
jgi:hypothetical protein